MRIGIIGSMHYWKKMLEIGFAHVLDQKVFLYNPIPDIPYYTSEIAAMKPVILHGDLTFIT